MAAFFSNLVKYEQKIAFPVREVWGLVSDFGSILDWLTPGERDIAASIELQGEGVGSIRVLNLSGIGLVSHRLEVLDSSKFYLGYSLLSGNPLGMKEYFADLSIVGEGSHSHLLWGGSFNSQLASDDDIIAIGLKRAYGGMSDGIEQFLRDTG